MTQAIVTAARGWLGTRFHHQGRVKRTSGHLGGVDCLGLLVGVAKELDMRNKQGIPLFGCDEIDYPHMPDCQKLYTRLSEILCPIDVKDIKAGDILLLSIDNNPQHLAIVSDYEDGLGIIHAYAPARRVVEHRLDSNWQSMIAAAFTL